jgi:hypothetical protein
VSSFHSAAAERFGQTRKALEDPMAELERTLRDEDKGDGDEPKKDGE